MSPANPIILEKSTLRKATLKRRSAAFAAHGDQAARDLARHGLAMLAQLPGAHARGPVSAFYPFRDEINCLPLLDELNARKIEILLPAIVGPGILEFRAWRPGDPLATASFDTREPVEGARVADPVLLLVPGVAFDRQGYRLGYGGGFYDRALERLRTAGSISAIGIAFDEQCVDSVPHEPHDQRLNGLLTPSGYAVCARSD